MDVVHVTGQRGDASRSYYQGQRPDPKMALEKQGNNDRRSQPPEEDMDIGYEDPLSQSFEGLEQRFMDDILMLSKEQSDAEDAENTRHREVSLLKNFSILKVTKEFTFYVIYE